MPCGCAYRLVTLMTTSTSPTRIHLSGMSSKKPCAMMSVEISEVIVSFIAISFSKTRCLPDSGFCFTPSEIAFFGALPRRHAPRFHFISEICGTGAGGACGEEETATTNSSLQTTLKTKKECEIALYRHDPERFTKALRPRLPSCHSNDNQYQPHQNPPFGDVQRKAVCYDVVRDKRNDLH